jgi:CubicO group peptidase (beta-lactamase class C family)
MARYLAFLIGSGGDDTRRLHQQVLARSSLEEMWVGVVPIPSQGEIQSSMGLTFFLLHFQGVRYVGHTGSQKAFFSFFYIDPDAKTGTLIALNTNGLAGDRPARPNARGFLNQVQDRMFREIFPLFREPLPEGIR